MSFGQILLNNPSFEDRQADATMPMGWFACEEHTTPDILPGFWQVEQPASEGNTFVGLITRQDGTYESIGQRLPKKLLKDVCYEITLDYAHSEDYVGYNVPIKFAIQLGDKKCKRRQSIFESEKVVNTKWKSVKIQFKPKVDMEYIIIDALNPYGQAVKGNILLDNISPIMTCSKV